MIHGSASPPSASPPMRTAAPVERPDIKNSGPPGCPPSESGVYYRETLSCRNRLSDVFRICPRRNSMHLSRAMATAALALALMGCQLKGRGDQNSDCQCECLCKVQPSPAAATATATAAAPAAAPVAAAEP